MARKDLLDIASLTDEELIALLDNTVQMKEIFTRSVKKVPTLRGRTVLTLFYENSTRTSTSFEIAAKRLSADVTNFDISTSSVKKGESIRETIETLEAMRCEYVVVRHPMAGFAKTLASMTGMSVINAGDGRHAHPTQALLDAHTVREAMEVSDLKGKKILIAGDIIHSRVARSSSTIFTRLGAEVAFMGPGSLLPKSKPFPQFTNYEDALAWGPDVIYLLRVQMERQTAPLYPSNSEYHKLYGVTSERLKEVSDKGIYLMHPGPFNRGVEISDAAVDYERSLINTQVENGDAARMSVLYGLKPDVASFQVS